MGADLIVAFCPWPTNTDNEPCPPSKALADEMYRRVFAALPNGEIDERWEMFTTTLENDPDRLVWSLPVIREAVDYLFGEGYRREVTTVNLRGAYWVITGGLSWGDVPTECYDSVVFLYEILNDAGFEGVAI